MNARITHELTRIPQGGLAQNSYRAAYIDARQNALGSHPELGPDPAEAHGLALRVVRDQYADFTPKLLP